MTHLVSSSPPIAGAHTVKRYAGYGILGANIPAIGDSGGASALNDTIDPAGEYYWRIDTPPNPASGGTLTIYPDLSHTFTGAADGSWPWTYRLYKTGQDLGLAAVTQTVGTAIGVSVSLTGQFYSFTQGSPVKSFAARLPGKNYVFSLGTASKSVSTGLVGVANILSQGTLGKGMTFGLTGQTIAFSTGAIGTSTGTVVSIALTGQAVSFGQGDLARAAGVAIPGASYNYTQGPVSTSRQLPLAGSQIAFLTGEISASAQAAVNVAISGQGFAFLTGVLGKGLETGVVGKSYSFSYGLIALQGSVTDIPFIALDASVVWSGNSGFVRGANPSVFVRAASETIYVRSPGLK